MLLRSLASTLLLVFGFALGCQESAPAPEAPEFTDESPVTIEGYGGDAMEPFITRDGLTLFFNSLNDSVNTSLYYATREEDARFRFQGEIAGANGTPPHLDAVPSMDRNGLFYFVSTRGYPSEFRNYQRGRYADGAVSAVSPVDGDFYVGSVGWIVMDAEISADGDTLYYANAEFRGGATPAQTRMGIARRHGLTFVRDPADGRIFENVNDAAFLAYAPSSTRDGRELYYTRLRKGSQATEICVSLRSDPDAPYSPPARLEIRGQAVEAPSLTPDARRIYYHKRLPANGRYHVFTMRRK